MPEWLKSALAAVGGGTVVLVGILTIFKGLLVKLFETGIETSFEKSFEKFKNKLERSNRAYEILLEREMRFYERLEPISAELIPLVHDLRYFLEHHDGIERESECNHFREKFKRFVELCITLKNENLIHQSYIPQEVFSAYSEVAKQMQDDMTVWFEMAEQLFSGDYEKIDYDKSEEMVEILLMRLAFAETMVRKRLSQLCGES